MRPQSVRQTATWALLFTAAWLFITSFFLETEEEPGVLELALTGVLLFSLIFLTMRMTNRITMWVMRRFGVGPPEPPAPPPPRSSSTERPEHAQRRRQSRRRRGSRARRG